MATDSLAARPTRWRWALGAGVREGSVWVWQQRKVGAQVEAGGRDGRAGAASLVVVGVAGTGHSRGGTLRATLTANDPRVAGSVLGTWNSDRWGTADSGALVQWGTAVLTNDEGSWEAPYAGVYTTESGDYISRWYVGKGG